MGRCVNRRENWTSKSQRPWLLVYLQCLSWDWENKRSSNYLMNDKKGVKTSNTKQSLVKK